MISALRQPLPRIRAEAEATHTCLHARITAIEGKLEERRALQSKKDSLEMCIRTEASLSKCEALLRLRTSMVESDGLSNDSIERAAIEFNLVQHHQSAPLPFMESLKPRIERVEEAMRIGLDGWFRHALKEHDSESVSRVLSVYSAVAKSHDAQKLFVAVVARPFLEGLLTRSTLDSGGVHGSCAGLSSLCNQFVEFVEKNCVDLGNFGFVTAVWNELIASLVQKLPIVFAPAVPSLFHTNFITCHELLNRVEALSNRHDGCSLLSHNATLTFEKRWNLAVYYQLRFQEIAGPVESALIAPSQLSDPALFSLSSTTAVYGALLQLWDDSVFLTPLVGRFLQFTLQIIARYSSWLDAASAIMRRTGAAESDETLPRSHWVLLYSDCESIREAVSEQLCSRIQTVLGGVPQVQSELKEQTLAVVKEASGVWLERLPTFQQALVHPIIEQCKIRLTPLRDIAGTYRMRNREAPTQPSDFISHIFDPLHSFYHGEGSRLSVAAQSLFSACIVEAVVDSFFVTAQDMLDALKKQGDALQRLRATVSPLSEAGTGLTDSEKICLQVLLDVRALGQLAAQYVSENLVREGGSDCAPWMAQLYSLVAPHVSLLDRH